MIRVATAICICWAVLALGNQPAQAQPQATSSGEVEIAVDSFGFGRVSREGDYAGIRLALRDTRDQVRPVVVRLHIRDADGDTALVQRVVTLNPGVTQGVWLYARLPFGLSGTDPLFVTVHELQGDAAPDRPERVGRTLATVPISASDAGGRIISPADALIGIVGRSTVGLEQYGWGGTGDIPLTAHERIELAALAQEEIDGRLPDSWLGFAALESLVWTGGDPAEIRLESAEAIREWVYAGGRLVIVLPPLGGAWTDPSSNPIYDLMPEANARRREGLSIEPLREFLVGNPQVRLPDNVIYHTFEIDPGAPVADAAPILATPGGDPVVVRRLVGAGDVTVIGIDLTDPTLSSRIDAQRIWHRVLGKRFDVRSNQELEAMASAGRPLSRGSPSITWLDEDFSSQIDKSGRASVGVLLGLVVFSIYLVAAGPGGFWLLKKRNWQHHAWVAFVMTAAAFTVAAWVGASVIRPSRVEIQHVTFVDHVFGQQVQRARVWFSALLPTYGEQVVSVGDPDSFDDFKNAITPWEGPTALGSGTFPDARSYVIDVSDPSAIEAPTRATVKKFQADWHGASLWRMPLPSPENPISFGPDGSLRGVLKHELPGALEDVVVLYIDRQGDVTDLGDGGVLFTRARAWARTVWSPGESLNLSQQGDFDLGAQYLETLAGDRTTPSGAPDPRFFPDRLEMIAMYGMLQPPGYLQPSRQRHVYRRRATHTWDLARWFTQPCLIIVGQITGAPSPAPLRVDGREVAQTGRTIVRWVYPLPAKPAKPGGSENSPGRVD